MFEIRCRHEDQSILLELDGDICVRSVPVLAAALEVLDDDDRDVIVDLADVSLLTAHGIGVLVRAAHHRRTSPRSFTVRGATGVVARVLEITGAADELRPLTVGVRQ